jgi:hypothetical protein
MANASLDLKYGLDTPILEGRFHAPPGSLQLMAAAFLKPMRRSGGIKARV